MNADWRLPDQTSLISEAPEWSDVLRVLVYYDGPQIVVLRHRERQFLGIAIDENDQAVRWLLAELSPLEFEGLLRGGTSIRSVASKDHVLIVDYSYDNRKVGVWEVGIRGIPESVLPEAGAPLPASVRRHLLGAQDREPPVFVLGGKEHILFGDLSVVTGKLQKLWNVVAQGMGQNVATLAATAVAAGSLKLQVYTDNPELFARIAERYRQLAMVSDDARALSRQLSEETPAVAAAYREYMHALADHRVEVLAKWGEDAAYLGHQLAGRAEEGLGVILERVQETAVEVRRYRGYFEGFWTKTKPRFEFYDVTTGENFTGRIDRSLKRDITRRHRSVTLGRQSQLYDAVVEIERPPEGPLKYTLKSFEPSSDAPVRS